MNRNSKKGFTIVELVIVIAVIAILAAVLIPTFAGLIDKANQSADQQAVTNMNKILAIEEKADNVNGVIEILIKNNYAGDLTTYYSGYSLAWVASENIIVLVKDNAIVYPDAYVGKELTYELINPMADDANSLTSSLVDGAVVYVSKDLEITAKVGEYEGFSPETAGEYSINLNNNTLASTGNIGSWVPGANVVISNGVISSTKEVVVLAEAGGRVELNSVVVNANSGGNPIQACGGTIVLKDVTASQTGSVDGIDTWNNSAIQVVSWGGTAATAIVESGTYTGKTAVQLDSPGYTIVINDGTFVGTLNAIKADYNKTAYPDSTWSIEINGGNFEGKITVADGVSFVINGGTFTVDVGAQYPNAIGAGKTVVNNGNGTWTVQ